jgi:pyruvate dehydrogenase E1 component alpha subunit
MTHDQADLVRMYEIMTTIKQCDEKVRSLLMSGQAHFFFHSPRGQEVVAAAMGVTLRPDDYWVTMYRGLHDLVAKGVPLNSVWAEWLGKATGACGGRGGPMHITDPDAGVVVNTGIVGAGLPIATGLALAARVRNESRVTVCSFGDGASNIVAFHEALNMASVWELPVVFLCQNNRYAESTAYAKGTAVDHVVDRAPAYRMRGIRVDGNDPLAMLDAAREAVEHARSGRGPVLLEADTYRLMGHYFGDGMGYMPKEELAAQTAADPVVRYRQFLVAGGHLTEPAITAIEAKAAEQIDDAYAFALASPDPDPGELLMNVYHEAVA